MTPEDERFFALAMRLAERGLGRCWPNPAVGAVVVREEQFPVVAGRGWTQQGGIPHAETVALEAAGERANDATLYVTLEPCAHHGRTPPCTDAIIAAGIKRIVAGHRDPHDRVSGAGFLRLRETGIQVDTGAAGFEEALYWLNAGHVLRHTQNRPFVQLKLALGADGLIAPGDGAPHWITGPAARAHGHLLRALADAILVGRGTVLADDPVLTCRLPGMGDRSPVRIVADSKLRTESGVKLFSDLPDVPLWFVSAGSVDEDRADRLRAAGAEIVPAGGNSTDGWIEPGALLHALAERGITRLLVEGGPKIAGSFLNAGVIDEAVIFESDKRVGAHGLKPFHEHGLDALIGTQEFLPVEHRMFGPDRMTVYRRDIIPKEIMIDP